MSHGAPKRALLARSRLPACSATLGAFTLLAGLAPAGPARAGEPPPFAQTAASATTAASLEGLTAEEVELARYLDLLENMELIEDLEMLKMMPVLEDDDDR